MLTRKGFGPLDCRDDLAAAQAVKCRHEAGGRVRDGAVVARVNDLWLNGFEQGQHGGHQLGHGLGHQRAHALIRQSWRLLT